MQESTLIFRYTTDAQRDRGNGVKTPTGKSSVVSMLTTFAYRGKRYTLAMPRNFANTPGKKFFYQMGGQVTTAEFQEYIAYAGDRLRLPADNPLTLAAAAGIRHVLNWISTTLPDMPGKETLLSALAASLATQQTTLRHVDVARMETGNHELTGILSNMEKSPTHTTNFHLDLGELQAPFFDAITNAPYIRSATAQCQILPLNQLGHATYYNNGHADNERLRMDGLSCELLTKLEAQRTSPLAAGMADDEKDDIGMVGADEQKDEEKLSTQAQLMQNALTFKVPGATFRVFLSRKLGGKSFQQDMNIVGDSGLPRPGMLIVECTPDDGPPFLLKAAAPYFIDAVKYSEAAIVAAFAFMMGFKNDANTCQVQYFMEDYLAQKRASARLNKAQWTKENLLAWTNPNSPKYHAPTAKEYVEYLFKRLKEIGSRKGYADPGEYLSALMHEQLKGTLEAPDLNNKALLLELCAQPDLRPQFLGGWRGGDSLNKKAIQAYLETNATIRVRVSTLELHGHLTENGPFSEKKRLEKAGRIKTIDGVQYVEYTVPQFVRNRIVETLKKAPGTFSELRADYRKKSQEHLRISKNWERRGGHGVMYYQPNFATGGMDAAYAPEQFGEDGAGKKWSPQERRDRREKQKKKFMDPKRWSFGATAALLEKLKGKNDPVESVFVDHDLLEIRQGQTLSAEQVKERVLAFYDENWTIGPNSSPGFGQGVWVEAVTYPAQDPANFQFNPTAEQPRPQKTLVGFETSFAEQLSAHKQMKNVPALWTTMMGGKVIEGKPTRFVETAEKETASMATLYAGFKKAGLHRAGIELACYLDRMQIRFSFVDAVIYMKGEHTAVTWDEAMRLRFAAALLPRGTQKEQQDLAAILLKVVQQEPLSEIDERHRHPAIVKLQAFMANEQANLDLEYDLRDKLATALVPEVEERKDLVNIFMQAMNHKPLTEEVLAAYPMLNAVRQTLPTTELLNRDVYLRGKLEEPGSGDRVKTGGKTGVPMPDGSYQVITRTDAQIKALERETGIKDPKPPYVAAHLACTFTELLEYKQAKLVKELAKLVQAQPVEAPPQGQGLAFGFAAEGAAPVVVQDPMPQQQQQEQEQQREQQVQL